MEGWTENPNFNKALSFFYIYHTAQKGQKCQKKMSGLGTYTTWNTKYKYMEKWFFKKIDWDPTEIWPFKKNKIKCS